MTDSTSAMVGFKTTSYQSWVDLTNIVIFISSNLCGSYQEPIILCSALIIQLAVDQTNPLDQRCLIPRISPIFHTTSHFVPGTVRRDSVRHAPRPGSRASVRESGANGRGRAREVW